MHRTNQQLLEMRTPVTESKESHSFAKHKYVVLDHFPQIHEEAYKKFSTYDHNWAGNFGH